nr:class I SAM-dependent methyltransferase [Rhodococcus sp. (in: high G+C Gram-positive bacteria)]
MDEKFWDDMYGRAERVMSGKPNPVLTQQVTGLSPGRALDVGCGEGDDARWLAAMGWTVTAADISSTALERAASLTEPADITWVHANYLKSPPPATAFDLVAMHYFALPKADGPEAALGIAESVAPGGTLLVVNHAVVPGHEWNGIRPSDFYEPHGIAELLGEEWTALIDDTRPRTTAAPAGSGHTHDTVMRATRRR